MISTGDILEAKIEELVKLLQGTRYTYDDCYTDQSEYLEDILSNVEADGSYVRGVAEQGPGYDHGGQPGEPAYFEDIVITIDGLDITDFITDKGISEVNDALLKG